MNASAVFVKMALNLDQELCLVSRLKETAEDYDGTRESGVKNVQPNPCTCLFQ